MTNNHRILLAAPTSIYKDYILLEWYLWAKNLTYKNYEILICDNSLDTSYYQKLKAMGIPVIHVSPVGKTPQEYIAESQNKLRDYFIKGGFDYYFSLEIDIFPPRNIIEKLLSCGKDVVSAPYFYELGNESNILLWYFIKKKDAYKVMIQHKANLYQGIEFLDGTVKQIYQSGIGCTMIARKVMEKIPFRWKKGVVDFSDSLFFFDMMKMRVFNWMDTSILCKHYNSDWNLNPDHKLNSKDIVV